MSSSNQSNDHAKQDYQPPSGEQEHSGSSGEGAASALAHLKTQTRQHRRYSVDNEESGGGTGQ